MDTLESRVFPVLSYHEIESNLCKALIALHNINYNFLHIYGLIYGVVAFGVYQRFDVPLAAHRPKV